MTLSIYLFKKIFDIILSIFPIGTGKSVTMYGNTETKGVLSIVGAFLLEHSPIKFSMVELDGKKCSDLMDSSKKAVSFTTDGKSIATNAEKVIVSQLAQLEALVNVGKMRRTTKGTNQNATSSRTHAISIVETDQPNCQLVMADLAGFESSVGKENHDVTNKINGSLAALNKVLLDRQKHRTPSCGENDLIKFLKPALQHGKITLLYHIQERTVDKYLNLIDSLMNARQVKIHPKK